MKIGFATSITFDTVSTPRLSTSSVGVSSQKHAQMKPNKAAYQQCQKCVRTNILMEENITMYIDTLVSIVAALFTGSITGLLVSKIKRSTGFSLLGDILLGTVELLLGSSWHFSCTLVSVCLGTSSHLFVRASCL